MGESGQLSTGKSVYLCHLSVRVLGTIELVEASLLRSREVPSPPLCARTTTSLYSHLICHSNFQLASCRAIAGNSPSGSPHFLPLHCRIIEMRYLETNTVGHLSRESPMMACSTPSYLTTSVIMIGSCNTRVVGLHMQQQLVPKIQKLEFR